jgi:WD40 repeat protein
MGLTRAEVLVSLLGSLLLGGPAEAQQARIPTAAVLAPDASLVAAQESGTLRVWDRATGKRLAAFKSAGMFRGALGVNALAGIVADERFALWRAPSFTAAREVVHTPKVLGLGRVYVSANGSTLCTVFAKDGGVGDPNATAVWNASGKLQARIDLKQGRIQGVALSPDGRTVAVFGDQPGARSGALLEVHRLTPRAKQRTLRLLDWKGPDRTTYSAAFSADGKLLALGSGTRVLLFNVDSIPSSKLLGAVETDAVKALFPPDGKRLCTLHAINVVGAAIWELSLPSARAARPHALLRPVSWIKRPTQGTLRQLAFDPKGGLWLITASYSPEVWVFAARGDRFQLERTLTP